MSFEKPTKIIVHVNISFNQTDIILFTVECKRRLQVSKSQKSKYS